MMRLLARLISATLLFITVLPTDATAQSAPEEDCSTLKDILTHQAERRGGVERPARERPSNSTLGYHGIIYGSSWEIGKDLIVKEDGTLGVNEEIPMSVRDVACESPAHHAGLRRGDQILSVNGKGAHTPQALVPARPGMTLELRVRRGDQVLEFTVVTTSQPATKPGSASEGSDR